MTVTTGYVAPHHEAWLRAHPQRTLDWLREKHAEGFDVHHLDGDPLNNDPHNLVLIEHDDHMRIHDAPLFSRLREIPITECKGGRKPKARVAQLPDGRWIARLRSERIEAAIRMFLADPTGNAWRLKGAGLKRLNAGR